MIKLLLSFLGLTSTHQVVGALLPTKPKKPDNLKMRLVAAE